MYKLVKKIVRTPVVKSLSMRHLSFIKLSEIEFEKHHNHEINDYSISLIHYELEDEYVVLFQDKDDDITKKSPFNNQLSFQVTLNKAGEIIKASFLR